MFDGATVIILYGPMEATLFCVVIRKGNAGKAVWPAFRFAKFGDQGGI